MAFRAPTRVLEYTPHSAVENPPSGTDMLQRLTYEHRELRKLWDEMQRAHIREQGLGTAIDDARLGDTSQAELFPRIMQALAEHETLELEYLYPAAARAMNDEWADTARAEHADIRDLLQSIDREDPADEGVFEIFSGALTRMMAHMHEEDTVLFPILRMALPPAELMIDSHSPTRTLAQSASPKALGPAPKVVDIAAAEREIAEENGHGDSGSESGGNGRNGGNGRSGRSRRLLRRR